MIVQAGKQILDHLKIKHTRYFLTSLKSHPNYPTLLSLSDVLKEYQIENVCMQVSDERLSHMPLPFIAHLPRKNNAYVFVTEISDDQVTFNLKGKKQKMHLQTFINFWDGVSLLFANSGEAAEPDYIKNRLKETLLLARQLLLVIGAFAIIALSFYSNLFFFKEYIASTILLASVLVSGLVISWLLQLKTFNIPSSIAKKMCDFTQHTDCSAVVNSAASKIFGVISWSEVGLIYYTWQLSILLFTPGMTDFLLLCVTTIISLPFSIFSVYYQAKVVKAWCPLCLIIQFLLWAAFFIFLPKLSLIFSYFPEPIQLLQATISLLIIVFIWTIIKPVYQSAGRAVHFQNKLKRFLQNKNMFDVFLKEQPKIIVPPLLPKLRLNENESGPVITVVTNTFCNPCALIHEKIEKLINKIQSPVQVEVIFFTKDNSEPRSKIASIVLAWYYQKGSVAAQNALKEWFAKKDQDYESWSKKEHPPLTGKEFVALEQQRAWCLQSGIQSTPVILFNGHILPDVYDVNDLASFF
jgi:uncharacterized membrane protein